MEALSKDLWVFIETDEEGKARNVGLELLNPGRRLADAQGGALVAVVIGYKTEAAVKEAAAYGADKIIVVDGEEYQHYTTDAYADAMYALVTKYGPTTMMIGATNEGRDMGPRLSCRLRTGLTADCTAVDYDEETGQAYMLPSQTPDTFKGRYNRGILKGRFSIDAYLQNRELQDLLTTLDLDAEKFWYLLLFCYDCSWGKCMEGIEIKESPKEQIEKFVNAISEDYKRDTPFGAVFKSPICITLKIGRKNIVIDNKTAIASIAKFCADGLETVKSDQMNTSHVDLSDPHTESFSVFAYYFSQMIITALNYQEQVKEKRKKGANKSDKEKTLIYHLLYFTGIVSNESVLVDYDYLKSLLKQYKDKDIRSLNAFYY